MPPGLFISRLNVFTNGGLAIIWCKLCHQKAWCMEVIWWIRWWSGEQESASCLKSCQSDGLLNTRVNTKISHQLIKWTRKNEKTSYLNTLYPCLSCTMHMTSNRTLHQWYSWEKIVCIFKVLAPIPEISERATTLDPLEAQSGCTLGTEDKLQIEQDISFKQILADKDWLPRALSTQDGFCHFYCRHDKTIKSQHKSSVPKTHQK